MSVIILVKFGSVFLTLTINILGSCFEITNVTVPISGGLDEPQWSVTENALYWVDNDNPKLFRMDGKTGEIMSRDVCYGPASFIIPVKDHPGYVVVAVRTSVFLLKWGAPGGDTALRLLTTIDLGKPDNTIDDGKVDAAGRLWFGTFGLFNVSLPTFVPLDEATLYSMDSCNYAPVTLIQKRPVSWSSGIAWSLDNKIMYYNDAPTRKIVAFDYDLAKGKISNETVIFSFDDYDIDGVPEGMVVDVDGNLWVGTYNTSIININPVTGELIRQIELPVDRATAPMWGGENLDTLYVTTSDEYVDNPQPLSGTVLKITDLGTSGVPQNQFIFSNAPNY